MGDYPYLRFLPILALGLLASPPVGRDCGGPRFSAWRDDCTRKQRHPSINERRASRKAQRQAKRKGR